MEPKRFPDENVIESVPDILRWEHWQPINKITKVTPEMESAIEEICKRVINEKLKELGLYDGD